MQQLRLKKEARRWEQKADDEDDRARSETRIKLRDEIDKYLELIEQSLQGSSRVEDLFAIRWRVIP